MLVDAFGPGEWPEAEAADRFLSEGKLDRILALYGQAMRLDAGEPAYPWNLGSAMNASASATLPSGSSPAPSTWPMKEVRTSGPAPMPSYLAEVAVDAGEYDLALTALAHARADDQLNGREAQIGDLLKEVRTEQGDPQPQASLALLLERLPA